MIVVELDVSRAIRRLETLANRIRRGMPKTTKRAGREMQRAIARQFATKGEGKWTALASSTLAGKRRLAQRGKIPARNVNRPLVRSGEMLAALTQGGEGGIVNITPFEAARGLSEEVFPFAELHQEGSPGGLIPQREFLVIDELAHENIAEAGIEELREMAGEL